MEKTWCWCWVDRRLEEICRSLFIGPGPSFGVQICWESEFQVVILDQSGLEMSYPWMEATLDGEDNGNTFEICENFCCNVDF